MSCEVGIVYERELDQQLEAWLAIGVRQRIQHAAQGRAGVGAAAVQPEAPGQEARRIDAQGGYGRALRDAGEYPLAVLGARVQQ
jgi:hypothetical protein